VNVWSNARFPALNALLAFSTVFYADTPADSVSGNVLLLYVPSLSSYGGL
jgi:hypothetical protein